MKYEPIIIITKIKSYLSGNILICRIGRIFRPDKPAMKTIITTNLTAEVVLIFKKKPQDFSKGYTEVVSINISNVGAT